MQNKEQESFKPSRGLLCYNLTMISDYCILYLVRHGETEWNVQKKVQGHVDSPLTALGVKQAESVAGKLNDIHFDAVFSSDLLRAKRTAEIIIQEKKLAIRTSRALRERHYGIYEGKPSADYQAATAHVWEEFNKLTEEERKTFPYPDGIESDEQLGSRFITFLREIAISHMEKTVLVVSHGGALRNFLIRIGYAHREDMPAGSVPNGAFIKIKSDGIDFFVESTLRA